MKHSPQFMKEIQANFERIKQKLALVSKLNNGRSFDFLYYLKPVPDRLTQAEIEFLKKQFALKETYSPNFDIVTVDSVVRDLAFFTKFNQSIRMVFLSMSKLVTFERGDTVFERGDSGDSMFVILRGSVNVIVPRKRTKGNRVVACLYDGSSFGEYSILGLRAGVEKGQYGVLDEMGPPSVTSSLTGELQKKTKERTKRSATIEVLESAEMLTLDRQAFKRILMSLMQTDLSDKLHVLMHLPYFEVSPFLSLFFLFWIKRDWTLWL
jgi:CRP-like cAMP-binding protein